MSIPILRPLNCRPLVYGVTILAMAFEGFAAPKPNISRRRAVTTSEASEEAKVHALDLGRESQQELATVENYAADFRKSERVGPALIEQAMDLKFREAPFSVYLRFTSPNELGREALFVKGAFDGRLLVHQPGVLGVLAGTHRLKIDDWPVSLENRHPVTEIGMSKILEKALLEWQAGQKAPPKGSTFRISQGEVDGESCEIVEVEYQRKAAKRPFSLTRVFFSEKGKLPIRAERYGWPEKTGGNPPVLEIYEYRNVQLNVGLTDADFDPTNASYGFAGFQR